ncbi:MAG TPA: replication protein RepA [Roseomonas sp.]
MVAIAAEVLADDAQRIGISYAGFCVTSLPHKALEDGASWLRKGPPLTLLVEPGTLVDSNGAIRHLGVPYGARARMILLYLQTHAVRSRSREVELGASLNAWLKRLGFSSGGETRAGMREQAARIAACRLQLAWHRETDAGRIAGGFLTGSLSFARPAPDGQGMLWQERVVLDEAFYAALTHHPVPLQEAALRALRDRSMSLDLYVWLAYRLHSLTAPLPIRWAALHGQFGAGYAKLFQFKPRLLEALSAALAAYPGARVEVELQGLVLHPSSPPVAAALVLGHRFSPTAPLSGSD